MRNQHGSPLYSLGEREVKIFSFGLTALLVLTFGAGMLLGTFWTGPVVERARREAEEEMRLAAAGAAAPTEPAGSLSERELASPPSPPVPEPSIEEPPAIITEPVSAAEPEPFRARPVPSWRRPAPPPDQPAEPEPATDAMAPQGVYALQLGIFSVESNAAGMLASLAARGYEPYQVEEHRQKLPGARGRSTPCG